MNRKISGMSMNLYQALGSLRHVASRVIYVMGMLSCAWTTLRTVPFALSLGIGPEKAARRFRVPKTASGRINKDGGQSDDCGAISSAKY